MTLPMFFRQLVKTTTKKCWWKRYNSLHIESVTCIPPPFLMFEAFINIFIFLFISSTYSILSIEQTTLRRPC